MKLDLLVKIVKYVNKIPSSAKTLIIVVLAGLLFINYVEKQNKCILKEYGIFTEQQERMAESYTLETASTINRCVSDIATKDQECFNVLLLNYHNTQKSLQGFRYLYLNLLTEKPKGLDNDPVKDYWSNLEYVYYEDELARIHNNEYLIIDNIESIKPIMPKIYKRLKISGAESASFYTIEGLQNPIGLVIILYKDKPSRKVNIIPEIQKLAVLLDYENLKHK